MAYAAYRDHEVLEPPRSKTTASQRFLVLPVTVSCIDAWRVRQAVLASSGAGVVRCQVLIHENSGTTESSEPRARLLIRLAAGRYLEVIQAILRATPCGELGGLMTWTEHLRQCALEPANSSACDGSAAGARHRHGAPHGPERAALLDA